MLNGMAAEYERVKSEWLWIHRRPTTFTSAISLLIARVGREEVVDDMTRVLSGILDPGVRRK